MGLATNGGYDGTPTSGSVGSTSGATSDGVTTVGVRTPNVFKSARRTTNGAIWTPAAGKKFRLMRYMIVVPGETSASAAGELQIDLQDSAASLGHIHYIYLNTVSVVTSAPPVYITPWIDLGNGLLSAAVNNVLNMTFSQSLTAGGITVLMAGTEE